ncbi:MAG: ABC-type transport auxiliary lipoprotein family protein [Casimicrobiaceae bacterium]
MNGSRRDWIRRTLAVAAALGLAAGCARPGPVKGTYLLEPPNPAPVAKTQAGLLRVGSVTVGAPFRGRNFVFRETELKYETDYYHEFLVAPAANIGEVTARALGAAKVFTAVTPPGVIVDPDWALEGFVDALYGDARNVDKPTAVLTITYFLRRANGDAGVPVWSKTYERRVPFTSGSAGAYVGALNSALGEILAELAKDLAAAPLAAR